MEIGQCFIQRLDMHHKRRPTCSWAVGFIVRNDLGNLMNNLLHADELCEKNVAMSFLRGEKVRQRLVHVGRILQGINFAINCRASIAKLADNEKRQETG